jgi:predicted aspartyl protease
MKIKTEYGLPFVETILSHKEKSICSGKFLIDTGSASTLISAEIAVQLGLGPEPNDIIREIRGVGGTEYVYEKNIDSFKMGIKELAQFKVQVGDMEYGFDMDGIIGYDFLIKSKVVINLDKMLLE